MICTYLFLFNKLLKKIILFFISCVVVIELRLVLWDISFYYFIKGTSLCVIVEVVQLTQN